MKRRPIAHTSPDGCVEPLEDHLRQTSELCGEFADSFGSRSAGLVLGAAHDAGKCSEGFQRRLQGGPRIKHAAQGALELQRIVPDDKGPWATLLSYGAVGHHAGLPDGGGRNAQPGHGTLVGQLKEAEAWDRGGDPDHDWSGFRDLEASRTLNRLEAPAIAETEWRGGAEGGAEMRFALQMWGRMMASCLIDADRLCTERFHRGFPREAFEPLPVLKERLEGYLGAFWPPRGQGMALRLNEARCRTLDDALRASCRAPGVYTLTVPCGGAKTLAYTRFALAHAVAHGMGRVVVAAPTVAVADQVGGVLAEALGEGNVLVHHSGTDPKKRLKLASENWDAPVVVTSQVRLGQTLFDASPGGLRRLHALAKAVIVVDETQGLPLAQERPLGHGLAELVARYGSTLVFASATQSTVVGAVAEALPEGGCEEIAVSADRDYRGLSRVSWEIVPGELSDAEVAGRVAGEPQVLCVVDTRRRALDVARAAGEGAVPLTTLTCPRDRARAMGAMARSLAAGEPCRVVATSLVEAGCDLDFPKVLRAMAGIDSLVQAAGRCNRNGSRDPGDSVVTVFMPEGGVKGPADACLRAEAARMILALGRTPEGCLDTYFKNLSILCDKDDVDGAWRALSSWLGVESVPYRSVSERFAMIHDDPWTVVVYPGEVSGELARISAGTADRRDMRALRKVSVTLERKEGKRMVARGVVEEVSEGLGVLRDPERYDPVWGLDVWGCGREP
ncbi:CRISPR-associated endonuclease Cas3'' [Caniella muris]|uniref:CRISPR-associated endonuclease Cas3'' n=1 Tax=Caniella muris TaxID=2941502 RepID=UPI00203F4251|nr:CRISPR-associated endonuclease Cas3'' [Caniella muris]